MEALKLDNYTYQDYLDIDSTTNNDTRVELIFGEIYMISGCTANHQDTVFNIAYNIKVLKNNKCIPRIAPYDIKITIDNDTNVVQPDVMILCKDSELPCAVFEVLSPSTASKDKGVKKELYELAKIKEYYIVNTDLKIIDKFLLDHGKYYYVKGFNTEDTIKIDCIDAEISVKDIFENID
jgi:Uma2 family endonuclease